MGWHLAPGTGFCEAGGELLFLDLARDKYFALRGADRAAFDRLRHGEQNDSDAMTGLVRTGFLVRRDGPSYIAPTQVVIPDQDIASVDGRFAPLMGLSAATSLYWARRAMRPNRIAATVDALARAKRKLGTPGAEAPARHVAASYAACRWIVPIPPRCLIDALALDRILLARGLSVSLIFGVRVGPFAAHSWLQTPDTILTGTAAEARNFIPILAVG